MTFSHHQLTQVEKDYFARKYGTCTEEDIATAKKAIDWARNLEVDPSNDYLWNIRTIANADFVQERNLGLACSIIIAYIRATTPRDGNGFVNEFYLTVGEKFSATAKLNFISNYITQWGTTYVYSFSIDNKRVVWKTSKTSFGPSDLKSVFQIKGTIKRHEIYKENKQTLVERVKVLETPAPANYESGEE
jgi:hypothetical protein